MSHERARGCLRPATADATRDTMSSRTNRAIDDVHHDTLNIHCFRASRQ
jgi:hypothetical protein